MKRSARSERLTRVLAFNKGWPEAYTIHYLLIYSTYEHTIHVESLTVKNFTQWKSFCTQMCGFPKIFFLFQASDSAPTWSYEHINYLLYIRTYYVTNLQNYISVIYIKKSEIKLIYCYEFRILHNYRRDCTLFAIIS